MVDAMESSQALPDATYAWTDRRCWSPTSLLVSRKAGCEPSGTGQHSRPAARVSTSRSASTQLFSRSVVLPFLLLDPRRTRMERAW